MNQNWIFPRNCGLDFSNPGNPPVPFTWGSQTIGFPAGSSTSGAIEGCACISDDNGNLLMYTDGVNIWDGNHNWHYGQLKGDRSSTQSGIIVPDPGSPDHYYIFTTDGSSNPNPPYHHFDGVHVDINNLANPTPIFPNVLPQPNTSGFSPVERLIAVPHANCRDYWVLVMMQVGTDGSSFNTSVRSAPGVFRVFLVDPNGMQHVGDTPLATHIRVRESGYLKASKDGKHIAFANMQDVLIFPFDNATGTIAIPNQMRINASFTTNVYGVEFSPDSQLLYFSDSHPRMITSPFIWQVDFLNSLTPTVVGTFDPQSPLSAIGALQLGIDDVIYFTKLGRDSLGGILDPNTLGTGCNVTDTAVTLPPGCVGMYGLPNIMSSACRDNTTDDGDCGCGCNGCNEEADAQNTELIERATEKFNTVPATENDPDQPTNPFPEPTSCSDQAISTAQAIQPNFYFHWGDSDRDVIEEHDTEVFYLTVCNPFNDITFKGLRITSVTLSPDLPIEDAHIVPDRLIELDCLEACSCETREFALITRGRDFAGNYSLEVDYCYDEIVFASGSGAGTATFPVEIIGD